MFLPLSVRESYSISQSHGYLICKMDMIILTSGGWGLERMHIDWLTQRPAHCTCSLVPAAAAHLDTIPFPFFPLFHLFMVSILPFLFFFFFLALFALCSYPTFPPHPLSSLPLILLLPSLIIFFIFYFSTLYYLFLILLLCLCLLDVLN